MWWTHTVIYHVKTVYSYRLNAVETYTTYCIELLQ